MLAFKLDSPFFQQMFDAIVGAGNIFLVIHDRHAFIEGHIRELVRLFQVGL